MLFFLLTRVSADGQWRLSFFFLRFLDFHVQFFGFNFLLFCTRNKTTSKVRRVHEYHVTRKSGRIVASFISDACTVSILMLQSEYLSRATSWTCLTFDAPEVNT